jgi:hypothetical protein
MKHKDTENHKFELNITLTKNEDCQFSKDLNMLMENELKNAKKSDTTSFLKK